jgi:hypothetical protein
MRLPSRRIWPLLLFAAAGCGSSSSTSNDMQHAGGPDLATSACAQTIDAYCAAAGPCVRDTASAQQAASWCPNGPTTVSATLQDCAGGQTVVVVTYSDSANHYVYAGGALVAIFTAPPHATDNLGCVAGPAMIAPPSGCGAPTTLCAGP